MLVQDVINLLYYEHWTDKQKCFDVWVSKRGFEKRFLEEGGLTRMREHCVSGVKICHGWLHGQRLLKRWVKTL